MQGQISKELVQESICEANKNFNEAMLDRVMDELTNKLCGRIVHEFACIYEIDTE